MEHKIFAAERKMKLSKADSGTTYQGQDVGEVVRLLLEIKADLGALKRGGIEPQDIPIPAQNQSEPEQPQKELTMMRTEMRALAVCIEHTKAEIAALRPSGTADDRLLVVANELDAIVESTEHATETILEAAEKLDSLGHQLKSSPDADPFVKSIADEIGDTIINIYEACNFQDITGQRISKVVKTLEFIEQRVMAMIGIWGDEAIAELQPTANTAHADEESKLLNGPQLASQAISQDDIDKLFG